MQGVKHIPNILTLSRVVVLVLAAWLAFEDWTGSATLVFCLSIYGVVSDFVDGYLARRLQAISKFGMIMDALVDKVMVLGALVIVILLELLFPPSWDVLMPFGLSTSMAAWIVVGLMAVREVGITLLRLIAAKKGVVLAAETSGKRKAIWQMTAMCVIFAQPMFAHDITQWTGWDFSLWADFVWLNGMFYFFYAAYLTIVSGAFYFGRYWRVVFTPAHKLAPA
jgi:CDP-diacylglycerol--glycerol-3-phosphate 3-phosphatidyltransferase|tara:strand:- start:1980 stop:2648 length:669 start_codon:yes stop_codon:yes gene_type:complete